jgi:hypothetical protein
VTEAAAPIRFSQGRLYLSRQACDRYLPGISTVILLRDGADLLVLPVSNVVSGGYMLKLRNAAGDRVVDGADFFRDNGLSDGTVWDGVSDWCQSYAGIRLYELFPM